MTGRLWQAIDSVHHDCALHMHEPQRTIPEFQPVFRTGSWLRDLAWFATGLAMGIGLVVVAWGWL